MTQETGIVPASDGRMSFGQTNLRPQDVVPPRIKVVQQMSKEAQGGKQALAQPGDFFNTLTGEVIGPAFVIQPIQTFMQRILLVRDNKRDAIENQLGHDLPPGQGLMCRSFDMEHGIGSPGIECAKCPLSKWDEETRKPPLCTETYNVAAMTELGDLVLVSFQKSSAKVGKRLFSALRFRPGYPWASLFELKTREERNDQGTFFVADFAIAKERPDTAQLAQALEWAKKLQGVVIDVSPEDDNGDVPTGPEVDPEAAPF